MLDNLRAIMLKASPTPPDPQRHLRHAQQALVDAKQFLEHVVDESAERIAVRQVEQREAEVAAAELALKMHQLQEVEDQLSAALQQKAELHERIRRQLEAVVVDLEALDSLETTGSTANARAFTLQQECGAPLKVYWHDAVLPSASAQVRRWLAALGG